MHGRTASEFAIYSTFWILALAFVLRLLIAVYHHRRRSMQAPRSHPVKGKPSPKWLTSGIVGLLVAECASLGIATALAARQWRVNAIGARDQRALRLDLHIPHVVPEQTYTVIAKFRVHGKQYVSGPLRVRFGPQKPVYHLLLYYDPRHPERNAWAALREDKQYPKRATVDAIAWILLSMLLLEWLQFSRVRASNCDGSGPTKDLQL